MQALLRFSRGVDWLSAQIGKYVVWLILASTVISALNAVVRKALNTSSNAFLEVQWYLFSAVFLLCAGYTLLNKEHVRVDLLLSRRREVMLIQVLSPAELDPQLSGRHTFCDAEETGARASRLTMDVDRDTLRAYRETVRQFLAETRRFCASRAVPYMLMRSDERAEEALRTKGCMEELIR